jgi:transcriptional regulator with XRE-family HTH domain
MKQNLELETPGERLRAIRAYCASSRQKFCKQTRLSESTLKAWENDVARLTAKGARALVGMFKGFGVFCTEVWLLEGKAPSPLREMETNDASLMTEHQFLESEFNRLSQYYSKVFQYFKIQDNHMAPTFKAGDVVAGAEVSANDLPYLWDEVALVSVEGYGLMLRKILKGSQPGLVTLITLNLPETHPQHAIADVTVDAAFRIVWHRSPLEHRSSKVSSRTLKRAL